MGQHGSMQKSVQGRETVLQWQIPRFSSLTDRVDYCCWSPEFECFNCSWRLCLFPNGRRIDRSEGSLELCLGSDDVILPVPVDFRVGIKTKQGKTEEWGIGRHSFDNNNWFVTAKDLPRSELFRRRVHLLPGDQLTIMVTVEEHSAQEFCDKRILMAADSLVHKSHG